VALKRVTLDLFFLKDALHPNLPCSRIRDIRVARRG
jgi:hypothetical protein